MTNDPLFANAPAGNYRLATGSPCVDKGTNLVWFTGATDLDGNPRIANGTVDMGAYEATGIDTTPPGNVSAFTAIPGNGQVGLSWGNPSDPDFVGVKVLRKTGGYPSSSTDGTVVYNGTGTSRTDTGLTNGTAYYYKAFSYDGVPNYASGVTANATPQTAGEPTVRYVSPSGTETGGYTNWTTAAKTIQKAIDACVDGDEVVVANGVYSPSSVVSVTKGITLMSLNGPTVTAIDGGGVRRCLFVAASNAVVEGFTIRNGNANNESIGQYSGGGVRIHTNGLVRNCIITNNVGARGGGVVLAYGGTLRNCLIAFNTCQNLNEGGGGVSMGNQPPNRMIVENCTITQNSADNGGGIVSHPLGTVVNSIVYGNYANQYPDVAPNQGYAVFTNCCTPLVAGTGNITSDPQFVAGFRLASGSPCINTGTNLSWMIGANDLDENPRIANDRVDMGAYEFTSHMDWSYSNLLVGLVAYYPFNGNANDASANGNNGTPNGASFTTNRFGNSSSAMLITTDYGGATSTNSIPISGNADRTMSFWCKFSCPTSEQAVVEWGDHSTAGANCGFSEHVSSGIWFNGHLADIDYNVSVPPYSQWRHLVFVYQSSLANAICYVDGTVVQRTGGLNDSSSLNTVSTPLKLYGLTGDYIDDVRIYNRALSPDEVQALHNYETGMYTVTFDSGLGTVTPCTKTVGWGESYGALPPPTRPGYIFGGWWTGPGGIGTEVTADTIVSVPSNHTLYAKFTINQYTLTVLSARAGALPGTTITDYGSSLNQFIINSPVIADATRYMCTGATVIGNDYTQVSPTNVTLTLTNDTTLTWQWRTDYWLATGTTGAGTLTPAENWQVSGSDVMLTATPIANWHFAGWSGDTNGCVLANNVITAPMSQTRNIVANFNIDGKTLHVISAHDGTFPGSMTADYQSLLAQWITNSPAVFGSTQYVCTTAAVIGNDFTQTSSTNITLTLTNDATLTWQWRTNYWLATETTSGGSITTADGWYTSGSVVALTATPAENCHLAGWSGDTNGCTIAGNVINVPMDHPRTIVARFAFDRKMLTVASMYGGSFPGTTVAEHGSALAQWITNSPAVFGSTQYVCLGAAMVDHDFTQVSPTNITLTLTNDTTLTWQWRTDYWLATKTNGVGTITAAYGWHVSNSNVTLTATPAANWHFAGWSGDTNECIFADNTITVSMNQPRTIMADFAIDQNTLIVTSAHNAAFPGTTVTEYGSTLTQWITNSPIFIGTTQFVCTGATVVGNDFTQVSPTNATLTLTNNASLIWLWTTNYWLDAGTSGAGSVSLSDGWQAAGSTVAISGIPTANTHFVRWFGDTNGCLTVFATLTMPMTQPRVVTAVFASGATPVISGKVTRSGSTAAVPGVTITFSNDAGTTTTGADGTYRQVVPYNWSGTATAAFTSGGFSVPTKTYTRVTLNKTLQNYTWAPDPFIAGRVTKSGISMPGVTMTFSNGGGTVLTDASGNYSNTVPYNWTGVVTPSTAQGGFNPVSKSYTALKLKSTAQNYTWAPDPFISGKVTKSGISMPGVTMTFSNGGGTVPTDASGNYSNTVPYNWTGVVTPSTAQGGFNPVSKSYTALKLKSTAQNYTWAPDPFISGKVTKAGSTTPVPGVVLIFSNFVGTVALSPLCVVTSDLTGAYSQTVPYNWTGRVTATHTNGGFALPVKIYTALKLNSTAQNFAWSPDPVISGKVTRYGTITGIPGVTLTFSNGGGEVITDEIGVYARTVPYGWTGVVTPTYANPGTFTPANRSYATKVLLNKAAQNFTWRTLVIPLQTQTRVTAPTFTVAPTELLHTSGTITWTDENAAMLSIMPEFMVVSLTDGVPEVRLPELAAQGEETINLDAIAMLANVVGAADCDLLAIWNVAGEPVILSLLTGTIAHGTVLLQDDDGASTLVWDMTLSLP